VPEVNPYSYTPPPAAAPDEAFKLYSPPQIYLAAAIGTPLLGLYLHALNRRRLGRADFARATLHVGLLMTAGCCVMAAVYAPWTGAWWGLCSGSVWFLANRDIESFDGHLARGGRRESSLKVAGLALAGLVMATLVFAGLALVFGRR
jgi:hypothetical protein